MQDIAGLNPARGSSFFLLRKKELFSGVVVYSALSLRMSLHALEYMTCTRTVHHHNNLNVPVMSEDTNTCTCTVQDMEGEVARLTPTRCEHNSYLGCGHVVRSYICNTTTEQSVTQTNTCTRLTYMYIHIHVHVPCMSKVSEHLMNRERPSSACRSN